MLELFDNLADLGSYCCMSIESKPRVGLLEQLKAATDLEQVKKLTAEFNTFTCASNKTRSRFARLVVRKTKELS